jgi:hypothetical protein
MRQARENIVSGSATSNVVAAPAAMPRRKRERRRILVTPDRSRRARAFWRGVSSIKRDVILLAYSL